MENLARGRGKLARNCENLARVVSRAGCAQFGFSLKRLQSAAVILSDERSEESKDPYSYHEPRLNLGVLRLVFANCGEHSISTTPLSPPFVTIASHASAGSSPPHQDLQFRSAHVCNRDIGARACRQRRVAGN